MNFSKLWKEQDRAIRQLDRQWEAEWREHVEQVAQVNDHDIRRGRLIREGLLVPNGLSPIPVFDKCLKMDEKGRDSALLEIRDFYERGALEERET